MIGIGLIGFGYWGEKLLKAFSTIHGCGICWIADTNSKKLEGIPNLNTIENFHKELDSPGLNAIVVATPSPTHFAIAKDALEAGKHVFVEKPLAMCYEDAEQLKELAEKKNLIFMVNHLMLYHPAIKRLLDLVRTGEVGKICYVHAQRLGAKVRNEESVLWSLGPHDLSIVLELLGNNPISIKAIGKVYTNGNQEEDVVFLSLDFPNNIAVHLHFSWIDKQRVRYFTVVGNNGSIVFDDLSTNKLIIYKEGNIIIPKIKDYQPLNIVCQHFVDCIKDGQEPITDGKSGSRVIKILDQVQGYLDEKR